VYQNQILALGRNRAKHLWYAEVFLGGKGMKWGGKWQVSELEKKKRVVQQEGRRGAGSPENTYEGENTE